MELRASPRNFSEVCYENRSSSSTGLPTCEERIIMLKRLTLLAIPFATFHLCAAHFPDPATDIPASNAKGKETIVLAGGCFWGVEAVFDSLKGVTSAVSGYAGGSKGTASYETVSTG